MDGDSTQVVSMVHFFDGGVNQRTFGLCAAGPLLKTQTSSSPEKLRDCLAGIPQQKAMYKVKQHSNSWFTV